MTETATLGSSAGMPGWRAVLGLVAVAVALRLAAALLFGSTFYFADEGIYLDASRHLSAGDGFPVAYTNVPGYPALLAALGVVAPGSLLALRCMQALAGGAAAALVLALAHRLLGGRAAAGVLYAFDPLLVAAAALLFPEALAAVALSATLFAVFTAAATDRLRLTALAGLLLGLLVLCRPPALVLVPLIGVWLLAYADAPPARRLVHALVLAICCTVAIAPWAIRNTRVHGSIVPASTPGLQDGPIARTAIASDGLAPSFFGHLRDRPFMLARHLATELPHFWEPYPTRLATDDPHQRATLQAYDPRLSLQPLAPAGLRDWVSAFAFATEAVLALVGIAIGWRRHRAATILLVGVMVAYSVGYSLFVAKLRYRTTVTPCVLLLAGLGAEALTERVRRHRTSA